MGEKLVGDPLKILKPYLGHWDVPDNDDLVLTIDEIYVEEIKNQRGSEDRPVIHFAEKGVKPMVLNKTNRDSIANLYGKRTVSNDWKGKKIALYAGREPKSADGLALRIRDYVPKTDEAVCEDCGSVIKPVKTPSGNYTVNKIVTLSREKYGRTLCWDCCKEAKEADNA